MISAPPGPPKHGSERATESKERYPVELSPLSGAEQAGREFSDEIACSAARPCRPAAHPGHGAAPACAGTSAGPAAAGADRNGDAGAGDGAVARRHLQRESG